MTDGRLSMEPLPDVARSPELLDEAASLSRRRRGPSSPEGDVWSGTRYPTVLAAVEQFAREKNADRVQLVTLAKEASKSAKVAHGDHLHRTCITHLYHTLAFYAVAGDRQEYASALGNLAVQFQELNDNHRALRLQEEALRQKQAAGNSPDMIARSLFLMGVAHANLGNLEKALELHRRSIEVLPPGNDKAVAAGEWWIARLEPQIALHIALAQTFADAAEPGTAELAGSDGSAALQQARSAAAARREGNVLAEAGARLRLAEILYQKHRLFSDAYVQAEEAERLAQQLSNSAIRVRALMTLGNSAMELGRFKPAYQATERQLVITRQRRDYRAAMQAQLKLALICMFLGEEQEAREHIASALDDAARIPVDDVVFETLEGYGHIFKRQEYIPHAIDVLDRAVRLAEPLAHPTEAVTGLHNELADAYVLLDRFADAIAALERGIRLAERGGDVRWLARAWIRLGSAYVRTEDGRGAQTALEQADPYVRKAGDRTLLDEFRSLTESVKLIIKKEFTHSTDLTALSSDYVDVVPGTPEFHSQVLTLRSEISRIPSDHDAERLAILRASLGVLLDRADERQEAEGHFVSSIELVRKHGMMRQLGWIVHGYGELLARSGRTKEARAAFAEALSAKDRYAEGAHRLSSLLSLVKADLLLGMDSDVKALLPELEREVRSVAGEDRASFALVLSQVYDLLGRKEDALAWSDEAVQLSGDEYDDDQNERNPDAYLSSLSWAAKLNARLGMTDEALGLGRQAAGVAMESEDDVLEPFRAVHGRRSAQAVDAILEVNSATNGELKAEALYYVELFKARQLIARQSQTALVPPASMTPELIEQEEQFLLDLQFYEELFLRHHELYITEMHADGYAETRAALKLFWNFLPTFAYDPEWELYTYGQLRQGNVPDLESLVSTRLRETKVHLICCHQSPDRLYVWHLDRTGRIVTYYEVPITRDRVNEVVSATRDAFRRRQGVEAGWGELSAKLFGPVLSSMPEEEVICFVPSGPLGQAPFSALHVDGGYLVERNPVAALPSLSSLAYWPDVAAPTVLGPALVLGDSLGDLRHARNESEQVAKRLGVHPLTGAGVLRASIQAQLAACSFLHVACHAGFDSSRPERSGFRLADGSVFSARDAAAARMRARIAVLSACESGRAEVPAGDDPAGLAASFLQAGVQAVIATLWPVDDAATAQLVTDFYDGVLGDRVDLASALRRAQRAMLQRPATSHPYYWAAFYMAGRWVVGDDGVTRT
jgi:CHAT domain-containing protein